ncbi:hypothetical protein RB195_026022 [Necator americanus]
MASAPPYGEPPATQVKSKLDNLSRDDLIRFLKKQLEHVRLSKIEIDNLKELLDQKDSTIRELECEIASFKEASTAVPDGISIHSPAHLENGECVNSISEALQEGNCELKSEIARLRKDRIRIEDDLAAALGANAELRSKLDDAVQEATALREQQTAADVFSLELKDYEKKMVHLNKSLKETQTALEVCTAERNELIQQLNTHKNSSDRVSTECSTLMTQLHEAKQELAEEQRRATELQTSFDRLQDNFNVLAAARNDERVAFEEKIAQNETLMDLMRKTTEQKQMEFRSIMTEKELLKTRLEDLENDYESYKSRARYVLEQKAQSSTEQLHLQLDLSAANDAILELKQSLDVLQFAHDGVLKEARRDRMLREKAETAVRVAKTQTVEILDQMASVREELFNSNVMLKDRINECVAYQRQISDMEKKMCNENKENAQIIQTLKEDIAKRERVESDLTCEVKKAKKRYQQAMNMLEDWKNLRSRPSSADAAPQTSANERLAELPPVSAAEAALKASVYTSVEPEIQEETLEEILFGEAAGSPEPCSENAFTMTSVPILTEEIERLNKNLQHARELLNETEATNATLVDQSRLLKEEIRRLQRNEQRLCHVENTEYLKNIIMKFLSPERVSGERQQLIPILSTMLQLSPEEVENLNRTAAEDGPAGHESDNSWGSFLRWGRLN